MLLLFALVVVCDVCVLFDVCRLAFDVCCCCWLFVVRCVLCVVGCVFRCLLLVVFVN